VDYATGQPLESARGSSQSIIQRFLPEIDAEFAREQYTLFRERFVGHVLGAPGVREYPIGISGNADVDSGPLIFGISASASVVTIGAARMHGDDALARPLMQLTEGLGMPVTIGGRKRYGMGLLPIGDAFVAWSNTAGYGEAGSKAAYSPATGRGWRVGLHGLSVACIALLYLPFWMRRARRIFRRSRSGAC
jgi:hypothetical protein